MACRPLVALLVLLSVSGVAVGAVGQLGPAPTETRTTTGDHVAQQATPPVQNTTWTITLQPVESRRSSSGGPGFDIGAAVADDRIQVVGRLEEAKLDRRIEQAENDDRRFDLLQNESRAIDAELAALQAAERDAVAAYVRGDVSTAELLDRLARIDARTRALDGRIQSVRVHGEAIGSSGITSRAAELDTRSDTLGGPIAARIRQAHGGEVGAERVHVEATPGGAVLSTVADGSYHREAFVVTERDSEEPTISLREAVDVFSTIYPGAFDDVDDIEAGGQRSAGVYYITIATRSGEELTSFMDNRNQTVFRESYHVPVDRLPNGDTVEATNDSLRLAVQRTYPGGPVHVEVTDVRSGEPVNATILLRDQSVATTGASGDRWVPGSEWTASLTARTGSNRSVSVDVPAA